MKQQLGCLDVNVPPDIDYLQVHHDGGGGGGSHRITHYHSSSLISKDVVVLQCSTATSIWDVVLNILILTMTFINANFRPARMWSFRRGTMSPSHAGVWSDWFNQIWSDLIRLFWSNLISKCSCASNQKTWSTLIINNHIQLYSCTDNQTNLIKCLKNNDSTSRDY